MTDDRYRVTASPTRVDAASVKRLPIEPSDWTRGLRDELAQALRDMQGDCLHAVYASDDRARVDVENVLFYNVGTGPFGPLTARGLVFERSFEPPEMRYAWTYETAAEPGAFRCWSPDVVLGQFVDVKLSKPHELAHVWREVKASRPRVVEHGGDDVSLGIQLEMHSPRPYNLGEYAKPLLDGILCAFHAHDGTGLGTVAARLAPRFRLPPRDVKAMLLDDACAVLGTRNLVWPTRVRVQWNPADDRLVAVRIVQNVSGKLKTTISGQLFTCRRAENAADQPLL